MRTNILRLSAQDQSLQHIFNLTSLLLRIRWHPPRHPSHGDYDNNVFYVFSNHRCPDVKRSLGTDLCQCLSEHELRVFLEQEELQEGESISAQMKSVILTVSVHIANFTPRYADSQWCLDELVLMMELEYMLKSRSTIILVFYRDKPSELSWTRGKNGVYARSLCLFEEKKHLMVDHDTAPAPFEKWRNAISEPHPSL